MTKYITYIIFFLIFFHQIKAQNLTAHSIDSSVQKFMKELKIPGCAVAILKDNTVVKLQGYGMASLEFDVPVTIKTKFLLDSQTKLFTAIAMMKLQEQGKMKLDDPINLYLDSIPALWKNVTIRNLLTHSSGIHDDYVPVYNDESLMEYSEQELYHHALQQPLDFAPGSRVRYNNLGFFLATVLIEKVTHVPYQTFMVDSFFAPLGLGSISFAAQKEIVKNYATAYALEDDKIVHMRDYALSQQGFSYMMKASIEELAQFDKLFNEGKVINKKSINEMRKFFVTNDHLTGIEEKLMQFQGIAYEINFMDGYTTYSKGGAAGTMYTQIPDLHLTVIILSNRLNDHVPMLTCQLARIAEPALAYHQSVKDADTALTTKMKHAFIDIMSGKFDSTEVNPKYFLLNSPDFYKERKKDVEQLTSFIYAGQHKMENRNLMLSGEHADRVIVYNIKIGELEFPEFFYLSDKGKILFLSNELYQRQYF